MTEARPLWRIFCSRCSARRTAVTFGNILYSQLGDTHTWVNRTIRYEVWVARAMGAYILTENIDDVLVEENMRLLTQAYA